MPYIYTHPYPNVPNSSPGLARLTPEEINRQKAVKRVDYKSHFLIGIRSDNGTAQLIAGWGHLPTQPEIDEAIKKWQHSFAQFAICNAVGFWDVEQPSTAS